MNNCNIENCEMCQAHSHYNYLLTENISSSKAFHAAVAKLTTKMIEEMASVKIEECYEDGYIDGFVEALEDTADNLNSKVRAIRRGKGCTCDGIREGCSDCPSTENNLLEKCGADCDCVDECEINKAIRKSFNGE